MRIDQYLTDFHQGTRRQVFRLLRQGRVTVNQTAIDSPLTSVTDQDDVRVDGRPVTGRQPSYLVFNKPVGVQLNLDATAPHSLGGLLNALDREQALKVFSDLPKEAAGLVIVSDDDQFLKDVASQDWQSTLRIQLTGCVAELPRLDNDLTFEQVDLMPDKIHQVTTVLARTRDLAVGIPTLASLQGADGPVSRVAFGPLRLPVDLSVSSYRGLYPDEIDALTGPLVDEDELLKND
ncbi:S4 domain-containing protein [Levilactobacillus lindianensis]|uniref:S4 domain-containing protein n=1 Tax=Levilactobacillus lindianensis TaxID=2486018 RepID=UPI000F74592E|nr:S4 domain-containing protein [Levilactobacillus lindianensis]